MTRNIIYIVLLLFLLSGCSAYNSKYPLHAAIYKGENQKITALIKSGSGLESQDDAGMTPLLAPCSAGKWDTARALIEMGGNVNASDAYGNTPLFVTAGYCNSEIIKLMIQRGAKTNVKTADGDTPLHNAAYSCGYENKDAAASIEFLIEGDVDLIAVNKAGVSAYHWAMEYLNMDMVAALRRKGVTEKFKGAGVFHEALRKPSFFTPPPGAYTVAPDRAPFYELAIDDCNHMSVAYKTGLIMAAGPVGYGVGYVSDQIRGPGRFQKCMKVMGFKCSGDCAR
jgi:ankyrin repeat protein